MVVRRQGRARVGFWFFIVALLTTPAALQGYSCGSPRTGDATLSVLEMEVLGQNHLSAFDSGQRTYNVWLPLSADTAIVSAYSTDPASQVTYNLAVAGASGPIDSGALPIGGGEITFAGLLPVGRSTLRINTKAPGGAKAIYRIDIQVGCSDCDDGTECTINACNTSVDVCFHPVEPDDTFCDYGGNGGTCVGGLCEEGFPCTEDGIREAIAWGGGPHTFACNGPTTVTTQGEIVVDNSVILDGEDNLTVEGGNAEQRVFSVLPGVTVELIAMTITRKYRRANPYDLRYDGLGILNEGTLTLNGIHIVRTLGSGGSDEHGGGIYNTGDLTLLNSSVMNNHAAYGGGIYNLGTASLIDSAASNNAAYRHGGGIYSGGTLTLINSTVADNISDTGNEIYVRRDTVATLIGSTVSGQGGHYYGAIEGSAQLINSTVSYNGFEPLEGGSLTNCTVVLGNPYFYFTGTVTNTAIVWSGPDQPNCGGNIVSGGGNIESPGDLCGFTDPTDLVNVSAEDLKLGPLADNGGPTMTHALLPGSVAIDHVPTSMCLDENGDPLTTDQRGVMRPQALACDVGAFERAACTVDVDCDDGNECTADICDPANGTCTNDPVADGTSCDFGGVAGVCQGGECADGPPAYQITDLGPIGSSGTIRGVNNLGQVIGNIDSPLGAAQAFVYENGTFFDLHTVLGGDESLAIDINDTGQIVGYVVPSGGNPSVIQKGFRHSLPSGTTTFIGRAQRSTAFGINELGSVVGLTNPTGDNRAYVWRDSNANDLFESGELTDLGVLPGDVSSRAIAISDNDQIVGKSDDAGSSTTPVIWENDAISPLNLGTAHQAVPEDINNDGIIVGSIGDYGVGYTPFVLHPAAGVTELQTCCIARGVNQQGTVVGGTAGGAFTGPAFLWRSDIGLHALDDLIDPALGWTLVRAWDVNELGWVVGEGDLGGERHGFLLIPIP